MPAVDLFPRDQIVGVFRGFREGGLEFHADLERLTKLLLECLPTNQRAA